MAKKVLFIIGSLRGRSYNRQMANFAAAYIGDRAQVSVLDYEELPYMDQDIEFPAPPEVRRVRQEVLEADAIWIFTPEYNHSYPGVLKNLLDWLSRPMVEGDSRENNAIAGKKVAVSGVAGKSSAAGVLEKMEALLPVIFAEGLKESWEGYTFLGKVTEGQLNLTEEDRERLQKQADGFLACLE